VLGEEKLKNQAKVISLRDEKRIVALLDMIDGTDLVYRKMSNWCSALVFFDPQAKRILASVVGLPSGAFYCAGHEIAPCVVKVTSRAHEAPLDQLDREIPIHPNNRRRLKDSAVCFYGQKAENLLSIIQKECGLPEYLRKISLLPKKRRPWQMEAWTPCLSWWDKSRMMSSRARSSRGVLALSSKIWTTTFCL
jgi:hypothetical protein